MEGLRAQAGALLLFRQEADPFSRSHARLKWWTSSNLAVSRRLEFGGTELSSGQLAERDLLSQPSAQPAPTKPVFAGHYWLRGEPRPLSEQAVCADYSVAKGVKLAAYRWSGWSEHRAVPHSKRYIMGISGITDKGPGREVPLETYERRSRRVICRSWPSFGLGGSSPMCGRLSFGKCKLKSYKAGRCGHVFCHEIKPAALHTHAQVGARSRSAGFCRFAARAHQCDVDRRGGLNASTQVDAIRIRCPKWGWWLSRASRSLTILMEPYS